MAQECSENLAGTNYDTLQLITLSHTGISYAVYFVSTQTGDVVYAGTGARIFVKIYGTSASTSEHYLGDDFSRAQFSEFQFQDVNVGTPTKLHISTYKDSLCSVI